MKRRKIYSIVFLVAIVLFTWIVIDSNKKQTEFSERVKVSLREAGNQLLLTEQDSTSLILPVVQQAPSVYWLSFEKPFSFEPGMLVSSVKNSFQKAELPESYLVETLQCESQKVAYSYIMSTVEEKTIVPCGGRVLPMSCYTIQLKFTNKPASFYGKQSFWALLIGVVGLIILIEFFIFRKKRAKKVEEHNSTFAAIGSFQFYPEQNKLIKEAVEIALSKKECELLAIFVANPNQIIKRDELTKKVWEDNGVIVGRSLDTYISKLRKKLKDDDSIKLTNVHGVGYKLEVES